jgi:dihydrofolate reductase
MKRVIYRVAMSLDGFIAGPNGEIDWITPDPNVDFTAIYAGFDTALLGRRTFELTLQPGAPPWPKGWRILVFSDTLDPARHPNATIVRRDAANVVQALREEAQAGSHGRDIWLFGGGNLFGSLLAAGQVDQIEVAVMPVLLGSGTPLISGDAARSTLALIEAKPSSTGIVNLRYDVPNAHR